METRLTRNEADYGTSRLLSKTNAIRIAAQVGGGYVRDEGFAWRFAGRTYPNSLGRVYRVNSAGALSRVPS